MSIEKTSAIILSVMPYRETSSIISLLTRLHGRIQGIAKGIKKQNSRAIPVERGNLIDTVIYFKVNRDLQNLGEIQISDFFPTIRGDIDKTALRDVALELILRSISGTEVHEVLFDYVAGFLSDLDKDNNRIFDFYLLLNFCFGFADLLGFTLHTESCGHCGGNEILTDGGTLDIGNGGILCKRCFGSARTDTYMLASHIKILGGKKLSPSQELHSSRQELLSSIKLAVSYCRFHLGFKYELKSLRFLEQII